LLIQSRSRGSDVCSPVAFSAFWGKKSPGKVTSKDSNLILIVFPSRYLISSIPTTVLLVEQKDLETKQRGTGAALKANKGFLPFFINFDKLMKRAWEQKWDYLISLGICCYPSVFSILI
jgi:hypothetical protein